MQQRSRVIFEAYLVPATSHMLQELHLVWLIRLVGWLPFLAAIDAEGQRSQTEKQLRIHLVLEQSPWNNPCGTRYRRNC